MAPVLRRSVLAGGLALIASNLATRPAKSAPPTQVWQKWAANDPASRVVVDHQAWGVFLRRYVVDEPDGISRLRYGEVSAADRQALARYVDDLSKVAVHALNPAEQFAYWINLYNALTVRIVLDRYPVASIREISLGGSLIPDFITGGSGPWQAKLIQIEGEAVALDDIEHRILRPLLRDNRIHYAVNCASIGCPALLPAPVTAANLHAMLDRGARLYVNHPRGAQAGDNGLTVSSIYKWYRADFGDSWQGVLTHMRRYANPATAQMLAPFETVNADAYDWQLNDAATYAKTAQAPERG
jgi:Protein of unknown function, DUF547